MGTQYDLLAMPINVHLFHDLYRGSTIQFDDKLDCLPFYHNFWSATQKYNKIHAICIHQEMGNENEKQSNQRIEESKKKESKNQGSKYQGTKEPRNQGTKEKNQRIKGPKDQRNTQQPQNQRIQNRRKKQKQHGVSKRSVANNILLLLC